MAAAIDIKKLVKRYGELAAVNEIDLVVARGEIFGLLGPNGAGKSTLLMILSTLLKPTSGHATVNGFDLATQPLKVRQSIGMVFQDPSSDELLTGYENLKLHALLYDLPTRIIDKKIDDVLTLVGLEKRMNDKVKTYSGGMRRRMEIARGLLHQPEILFLDEPTLGLDPQTREHIWQYIETLAAETGMTIVLTTHYMEEAEKLCGRVAIIDHGKIIANDTTGALRQTVTGDIVCLKGKGISIEKIQQLSFVKKVNTLNDRVEIMIENAGKNLPALLHETGEVDFIEVRTPDLNDVFLRYTGTAIREGGGSTLEHIRSLTRAKQNK